MSFPTLISRNEYFKILDNNGMQILFYENLNDHLCLSYRKLSKRARNNSNNNKNDFEHLAYAYDKTREAVEKDECGMITIIARKAGIYGKHHIKCQL